jgi:hypothetical protein
MSVCVSLSILALVIRHANRIISTQHHTVTRDLSGLQYFSTLSHKGTVVEEKTSTEHAMCVCRCSVQFFSKYFSFEEEVSEILS